MSMRKTMQTQTVLEILTKLGHATNARLLEVVQADFPDISATTVHRITKRLVQERLIGVTRSPLDGSAMLDINPLPHYHFACQPCGKVEDIQLTNELIDSLQKAVGAQIEHDALVISGIKSMCPHYKRPTIGVLPAAP